MSSQPFFALEKEISSVTRMDAPLGSVLQPRWQRKQKSGQESAPGNSNSSGLNASGILNNSNASRANTSIKLNSSSNGRILNLSLSGASTAGGSKRPSADSSIRKTPHKTPRRSPGRFGLSPSRLVSGRSPGRTESVTPGRETPGRKTPGGGDRFIPSRSVNDFEAANFRLLHRDPTENELASMSPSKREFQRLMSENLDLDRNTRIVSYVQKAPPAPGSHANGLKVLYSNSKEPLTSRKTARHIPQMPERILDAPEIQNDYYLNLIDWSASNLLAVGLGSTVYLWNAGNGDIQQLLELESADECVCSVRWIKEGGSTLAIGHSGGEVSLWDAEAMKKIRTMAGHSDRVGSLSWNQHIVSSGSRSGWLHHSDVRVAQHLVQAVSAHSQEICGLSWSPDGRLLASGGNDNVLQIWSANNGECYAETKPKYNFTQHQAAVKALAWCPWQPSVLASGGGTADRTIKVWNCNNGTLLNSVDTKSQVCALLFSKEYHELVSSHGFAHNEVTIWKYPSMVKTAELLGHTERVLHMALSPDGTTVVSAGADETLRLWKCFAPDPSKKKECRKTKAQKETISLIGRGGIR